MKPYYVYSVTYDNAAGSSTTEDFKSHADAMRLIRRMRSEGALKGVSYTHYPSGQKTVVPAADWKRL